MSLYTYEPGKIQIGFGIPNLDLSALGIPKIQTFVSLKDWVSLTPRKASVRFPQRRGVWGETFQEYIKDTSRIFDLSILQTSNEIVGLRALLFLQEFGIIGMPFSVSDISKPSENLIDANIFRQKSTYPVGVIMDEPQESWALDGAAWDFQIAVAYGKTSYL